MGQVEKAVYHQMNVNRQPVSASFFLCFFLKIHSWLSPLIQAATWSSTAVREVQFKALIFFLWEAQML